MKKSHRTRDLLRWYDALWCAVLVIYIVAGTALVPLHGDEATFIFMGRDFYYHFVPEAQATIRYQEMDALPPAAAAEQQLRLRNGTVTKYLFGAAAYINGYDIDEINEQWAWNSGWDWNHANGHVPDDTLLLQSRLISAVLTAGGAIVMFGMGLLMGSRSIAYLASGFYTLHPVILLNGRRAMQEGGLLFFGLLVVAIGLYLLQHRQLWVYLALGIISGIAAATKHTAAAMIFATFLGCAAYWLYRLRAAQRWQSLAALLGSGLLSLVIFYGLNPAWWGNPLDRAAFVTQDRIQFSNDIVNNFGGYTTFTDSLEGLWGQGFVAEPVYAETMLDGFIEKQQDVIARYEQSIWSGITPGIIGGIVLLLTAGIGTIALWRDPSLPSVEDGTRWLLTSWGAVISAMTLFLTPLEWQRYYLLFYPTVIVFAALGMRFIVYRLKPSAGTPHD